MPSIKNAFYVISLFFGCAVFAQDVDYYKQLASNSEGIAERMVAMDSVISKTRRADIDTFISYSLDYIELAKEIDSIEAAAKKMINVHYSLSSIKNEPRKALTIIDGILARKYKINDTYLLGALYLKRGGSNYRLDLNAAVEDYQQAIENFGVEDSLYIADAYLFSGQAYSNMGMFVPAGESYRKAYN